MKTKDQNKLLGLPSWGLSLIIAFSSLILVIFLASILGSILKNEEFAEMIAYIIFDIIIAIASFIICRNNPKSIWYVPIIINAVGIISAIVEPTFWKTSLWMLMCGGWVLSLIGSITGAMLGRHYMNRTVQK